MSGLLRMIALIIATAVGLALFTEYQPGSLDAQTQVMGLPVVSVHQVGASGWLAFGQAGSGVLVIAQAGYGVVAFTQVGAAVFFGIGQLMVSLVTIGQLGIGLFTFVGQIGFGAQAAGQGVARRRAKEHLGELSAEVTELLSWRGPQD